MSRVSASLELNGDVIIERKTVTGSRGSRHFSVPKKNPLSYLQQVANGSSQGLP
jgi:hypothetical protein